MWLRYAPYLIRAHLDEPFFCGLKGISMSDKTFKVRDLRVKEKFCVDDAYVNGWSRYLDPSALAVYVSLCRHADKEQSAFPAETTIAEEHGICEKTVRNKIALLKEWNIIRVERTRREDGKWLRNTYFLVDKSEWIKPEVKITAGSATGKKFQNHRQQLPTKDSHSKDAHIEREINKEKGLTPLIKKCSSIDSLGEVEFAEIARIYGVTLPFVRSKYDDLVNYCESSGKRYKNYFAALRNFVKNGVIQIRKEVAYGNSKRGIDASRI